MDQTPPRARFTNLGYSLRRYYVDTYLLAEAAKLPAGSLVLDLGGQKRVKRGAFDMRRFPLRVLAANLVTDKGADLQCDAARLPLRDASVDVVLCAELLEHVRDPRQVLAEAQRVLRPGGVLLATVPFLFHLHGDPADYGRYTHTFWREALAELGFRKVRVAHQGLYFSVRVNMLEQYLNQLRPPRPFGRPFRWLLARLLVAPLKRWALWRERQPGVQANPFFRSFATGFSLYGQK